MSSGLTIESLPPVAGAPALVSDDLDAKDIGVHAIEQKKREPVEYQPAKNGIHSKSDVGALEEEIDGATDLCSEAFTLPRYLALVICGCFYEFQFRFGVELELHPFRRSRRFLKTSSPGTGFTFPSATSR